MESVKMYGFGFFLGVFFPSDQWESLEGAEPPSKFVPDVPNFLEFESRKRDK